MKIDEGDPYIPKGHVRTFDAVECLFAVRHPDLIASAAARKEEARRLQWQRSALAPHRNVTRYIDGIPTTPPTPKFSDEKEARLVELSSIEAEERRLREAAAVDIRSALAEGELDADVLTATGEWVKPLRSHWLGKDGLTAVWRSLLRVQTPGTHTLFVDGIVWIRNDRLANWISSISTVNIGNSELDGARGAPIKQHRAMEGALDAVGILSASVPLAQASLSSGKLPPARGDIDSLQIQTGAPGRPSKSMQLIADEFERRIADGTSLPKLAQEARALLEWLKATHPTAPRPTCHTIENNIRRDHLAYRTKKPTE